MVCRSGGLWFLSFLRLLLQANELEPLYVEDNRGQASFLPSCFPAVGLQGGDKQQHRCFKKKQPTSEKLAGGRCPAEAEHVLHTLLALGRESRQIGDQRVGTGTSYPIHAEEHCVHLRAPHGVLASKQQTWVCVGREARPSLPHGRGETDLVREGDKPEKRISLLEGEIASTEGVMYGGSGSQKSHTGEIPRIISKKKPKNKTCPSQLEPCGTCGETNKNNFICAPIHIG